MNGIIRLGDKLSSGGVVISASSTIIVDGIQVALVGDQVSCPIKGHGINTIIEGSSTLFESNQAIALHGAKCACGCSVISSTEQMVED